MAGILSLLAMAGFAITVLCFLGGATVNAQSAIQQVYAQLLIVTSVIGLLIATVAISTGAILNAIGKAQKLLEGPRVVVDPPTVVPSSTEQEAPQNAVPA